MDSRRVSRAEVQSGLDNEEKLEMEWSVAEYETSCEDRQWSSRKRSSWLGSWSWLVSKNLVNCTHHLVLISFFFFEFFHIVNH